MIQLKNISFGYIEQKLVLNDISFSVNKGDTLAIVGASGSGKSTILRLVAGILPNNPKNFIEGTVRIEDKNPIDYLKQGKLAFMFQEPTLFPNLSVKDNIEVPLKIKNISDTNKVYELINIVGLNGFENYLPKDLSGGMKTRVSLARSFTTDPELLLLDEPFSSLDIGWKQNLYDELSAIRKNTKATVIMVTHDIQEAIYLADTIIVLGRTGSIIDKQIINGMERNSEFRLSDVPDVYPHELSKIQNLITIDSQRRNFNINDLERIFHELNQVTGDETIQNEYYNNLLRPIREFSNFESTNKRLIDLYNKATLVQKFCLIWDIFQVPQDLEFKTKIFEEIYNNLNLFNECSQNFYRNNSENILSVIQNRINGNNEKAPKDKKWLYLCDLFLSSETDKIEVILKDVMEGRVVNLNDAFSKKVAEKLLLKLNEKKQFIYSY